MPDQTKIRGLQLALNSLDNALKVLGALGDSDNVLQAHHAICTAATMIEDEIKTAQQPRPYVGGERREKE